MLVAKILHPLVFGDGPRADDAHLTHQHVGELRQFVESGLPMKYSVDGIVAWSVLELPCLVVLGGRLRVGCKDVLQPLFRIFDHRAELPAREHLSVCTDTLVREEDWSTLDQLERNRDHDHGAPKHEKRQCGKNNIDKTLGVATKRKR